MPTRGLVKVTAVCATDIRRLSTRLQQTPYLQWRLAGNVAGRGRDGLVTLEDGATLLGEGTSPAWNEPIPDMEVPADLLLRARGSGASSGPDSALVLFLEVRNQRMTKDKLIGSAEVDMLALAAGTGNNKPTNYEFPLDTGGSVKLRVEFSGFPFTAPAPAPVPAAAATRVDARRVSAAGRVLLKRHMLGVGAASAAAGNGLSGAGGGAAASAGTAGGSGLWMPRRDQTGRVYYHNDTSGETVWQPPAGARIGPSADDSLPGDWQQRTDTRGRVYYFSPSAGVSQWEVPAPVPAQAANPVSAAAVASARRRKSRLGFAQ